MLAKLRKRFILITMSLIGVVLLAVLVVSVVSSYQTQFQLIWDSTAQAVGEGGDLRFWLGGGGGRGGGLAGPSIGSGGNTGGNNRVNTTPMQPVYLVVVDNTTGWLIEQDNSAAIDDELLNSALQRVSASTANSGFLGDLGLFYQRQYHDDGPVPVTRIAFADTSQLFSATLQQAAIAVLIFVVAMLVFFFISLFLSKTALRPVEQAWEQQRRFVADASHELKTPLTVILANNNIMQAHPEKPTSEQQQWLQSTAEEAQRMNGLVRDLLLLAQIEEEQDSVDEKLGRFLPGNLGGGGIGGSGSGGGGSDSGGGGGSTSSSGGDASDDKNTATDSLDLSALVERGLLQFDAVFFERGIEVKSQIEPGVKITGNEDQLGRLTTILLDNASKYSADKGTVNVSLDQNALLKVSNTGEPIAPDKIDHIFERFYRGDTSHSNTIEGNGLGLSLAKAIAEANGGKISVTSDQSKTVFYVQF